MKGTEFDRDSIMDLIHKKGVPCYGGSCSEVYLEKAFDNTNFRPRHRLKNAKLLGETSIMFLCDPTLSAEAIEKTCQAIIEAANEHFLKQDG